ncbi:MAG: 2-C-methyl-D-erythritol 2,4-cyclodiphosphate synthase [Oscillospiraceae bacterium]|nr:2-C-methyl-D-erythritol 2,4-cyclodiphosphate synthase [Oscillospiraceae bacterium]MDO5137609.1 2-C-methyl-D-erythritol 2,4-cyclodiphosphate synthase [Oscillospiraceae bacterium]
MSVTAVIVAGGSSSRMQGVDKAQLVLDGCTVLERSVRNFAQHPEMDAVVVVTRPDLIPLVESWKSRYPKLYAVVPGGSTRCLSVKEGLRVMPEDTEWVAIHDGARPFITAELISEVLRCARECGASAPAVPVVDTIKEADGDGYITCTLDRSKLRAIATPQIFRADLYKEVIADEVDSFDDCQLFEKAGYPVRLVPGDAKNFKITTRDDIARAKQQMGISEFRIGHGYDVHRLVEDRKLIIGGVDIPFDKGLLGHSDADVLLHAISDAVLGAASLRDIGYHFPDTDPKWEGADSRMLLRECVRLVNEKGYRVANVDATILCQRPKLAPYIDKMRSNIAEDMKISEDAVSVKATTEEGLGFTGEGKGIASHAVVLIREE